MSSPISNVTAGVLATRPQAPAKASRPEAEPAKAPPPVTESAKPEALPAATMVDMAFSQVAYTASLGALKSANKSLMGYLLNIKV